MGVRFAGVQNGNIDFVQTVKNIIVYQKASIRTVKPIMPPTRPIPLTLNRISVNIFRNRQKLGVKNGKMDFV